MEMFFVISVLLTVVFVAKNSVKTVKGMTEYVWVTPGLA